MAYFSTLRRVRNRTYYYLDETLTKAEAIEKGLKHKIDVGGRFLVQKKWEKGGYFFIIWVTKMKRWAW